MKILGSLLLCTLVAGALCSFLPYYNPYYSTYNLDNLLQHANTYGYRFAPYELNDYFGYRFYYPDFYPNSYHFYGAFRGECPVDGLYYNDDRSFVICSNGISYVQPCAPGSRNPPVGVFGKGNLYGYGDFCGVNVNDVGITN